MHLHSFRPIKRAGVAGSRARAPGGGGRFFACAITAHPNAAQGGDRGQKKPTVWVGGWEGEYRAWTGVGSAAAGHARPPMRDGSPMATAASGWASAAWRSCWPKQHAQPFVHHRSRQPGATAAQLALRKVAGAVHQAGRRARIDCCTTLQLARHVDVDPDGALDVIGDRAVRHAPAMNENRKERRRALVS